MILTADQSNLHMAVHVTKEELLQLINKNVDSLKVTDPRGWQIEILINSEIPFDHRSQMFRQGGARF
jgi:hypothetical protein